MSVENIQAQGAAQFFRTLYPAAQFVNTGAFEGLLPVFATPQTGTAAGTELAPTQTFDPTSSGAIDLRGGDGFALEFLGLPGSSPNPFGVNVQLVFPVYAARESQPIAYRYQQIYFSATGTIDAGASQGPGALAGSFGITSSHRYCVASLATPAAPTYFAQLPSVTSNRAVLHVYASGAPFALVSMWRVSGAATHPTDLQALYRLLVVNEARTSVIA